MITAEMAPADKARFSAALKQLALLSDKPVKDIMRQQGKLFAVDMARITERFGKGASTGKKHKRDIVVTIKSIYKNSQSIAKLISRKFGEKDGRRFWNWTRRGEIAKAQDMLDRSGISIQYFKSRRIRVGTFDGGRLHKKGRFGGTREILVVTNYNEVKKYINKMRARAGIAKSGWAAAARDLGGDRGIPLYAKKGHGRNGRGTITGNKSNSVLTIKNNVDFIGETAMFKGNDFTVWKSRTDKMEKTVEQTLKRRQQQLKRKFKL